jgi:hypothetical protein
MWIVALARVAATDDVDLHAVDEGVAALPVGAELARALAKLTRPQGRELVLFECLEVRAQWLTLGEEVVAPELDVLEKPTHVDTLAGVASEDGSADVVEVDHHLGLVKVVLVMPVPIVEAEEQGRENTLDGVKKGGRRVREVTRPDGNVVLGDSAQDLQDVRLLGEDGDFEQVLRLIL